MQFINPKDFEIKSAQRVYPVRFFDSVEKLAMQVRDGFTISAASMSTITLNACLAKDCQL